MLSLDTLVLSFGDNQRCLPLFFSVIELALPGIGAYLQETLSKEVLSEEGERLRRHYVGLVNEGQVSLHGGNEQHDQELETQTSFSRHIKQSTVKDSCTEFAEDRMSECFQKQTCYDDKHNNTVIEKVSKCLQHKR